MAYKPIGWVDGETPLNAENLNHMDEGIKSSVRSINGKTPDENGNVEIEVSGANANGGGLNDSARSLLITILQNAVFTSNQSGNIAALREALASDGSSGGDSGGDPDEPVVTDDINVSDGILTIVSVGSAITVSDGVMTIA